jgi:hypothetical protein
MKRHMPGNRKPFQGFSSIASYVYYCIEHVPPMSREEIIKPLLEAGYTTRRAYTIYDNYLRRYRERRMEQMKKEGVAVG